MLLYKVGAVVPHMIHPPQAANVLLFHKLGLRVCGSEHDLSLVLTEPEPKLQRLCTAGQGNKTVKKLKLMGSR
jgi:hypothetical protein